MRKSNNIQNQGVESDETGHFRRGSGTSEGGKDAESDMLWQKLSQKKEERILLRRKSKDYDEIDEGNSGDLGVTKERPTFVDYQLEDCELEEHENPGLILYRYRWVVLAAYFLTSAATGSVQGSLSTNRRIIDRLDNTMDENQLAIAKYSDLVLYLPANFISVWVIDTYGLKACISTGSLIMLAGSILRFMSPWTSLWVWFVGHVICMSSQAFLKNPVTKLASNWFGDKERGTATAIGIVSGPLGIFISKVLILSFFSEGDKTGATPLDETRAHWTGFIVTQSLVTIAMVSPALFLIRDKPPSPPSMVATKPRPVQTFAESYRGLLSNHNYLLIFLSFQCVNSVAIYGGEIQPFTD